LMGYLKAYFEFNSRRKAKKERLAWPI
jgi:hypothetical protein